MRHARVHPVGVELELPPGLACEPEVVKLSPPVVALDKGLACHVERPGLAGPDMEPDHADGEVGHAHLGPAIHGLLIDDLVDLASALEQGGDNARISGRLLVLGERLEQGEERPDVVGLVPGRIADGSQPAVGLLVVEDVIDEAFDSAPEAPDRRACRPAERLRRASRALAPSLRPCRRSRHCRGYRARTHQGAR